MEEVVNYVLDLRTDVAARRVLVRAGSEVTETRSYCYLASWWRDDESLRPVVCAFAYLAATSPHVAHAPGVSVGDFAADLVARGVLVEPDVEAKIIIAQSTPLVQLTTLLATLLHTGEAVGAELDYTDLFALLDSSRCSPSQYARQRLHLPETYFQHRDLAAVRALTLTTADPS